MNPFWIFDFGLGNLIVTRPAQLVIPQGDSGNPPQSKATRPQDARLFPNADNQKAAPRTKIGNRKFPTLLAIALTLLLVSTTEAQQTNKIPRVGYLTVSGATPSLGLMKSLRELGYIEGQNFILEFRSANGKPERRAELAAELVRLKVDVLIAPGTGTALALKQATKTIPIVFLDVTDPVAAGLVDSLAHPGGNVTGFSSVESLLAGKRLELLKETVGKLSRAAVLWDPGNPSAKLEWQDTQATARQISLQLLSLEITSVDKYPIGWRDASKAGVGAVSVLSNPIAFPQQKQLASLAAQYRLPAIYVQENFPINGGLMSYGPSQSERFKRNAVFIDKILKGTKPADLPVEQPTKFDFVVNLNAAKQIGLTIPPNLLVRANRVIR